MNKYNDELAQIHLYLKERLKKILESDQPTDKEQVQKLAHAVLITGTIAYEYQIVDKPSPKVDRSVFYNTIYDD